MQGARRLGPDDWGTLREVRLRALRDAPAAFASTFEDESHRQEIWWKRSIEDVAWFVVEGCDGAAGLAGGLPAGDDRPFPELISMWVDHRYRGSEAAPSLLSAVVEWARAQGGQCLTAWVSQGNARARRFYERAGFVSTGTVEPLSHRPEIEAEELRVIL